MAQLITGIFRDRTSAESAVDSLENLGYKREDISVLMHDRTRMKDFADLTGTAEGGQKSSTGAKIGASIGGTLAAIVSGLIYQRGEHDDDRDLTGATTTVAGSGAVPQSDDYLAVPTSETQTGVGTYRGDDITTSRAPATSESASYSTESNAPSTPLVAGPLAATVAGAGLGGLIGALAGAGVDKKLAEQYDRELNAGGIVIGVAPQGGNDARVRAILRNDMRGSGTTSTPAGR